MTKVSIATEGWDWVKETALCTVHKEASGEVTSAWKSKMLKAEHSPIRELKIRLKYEDIQRWIADQLVRSTDQSYMGTMRPDRGNKPRNEQLLTDTTCLLKSSNAQHIIDTSRKRLCKGKVSKETYELFSYVTENLKKVEPELAFHCVPNCIYRGGCPEMKPCGHYEKFIASLESEDYDNCLISIDARYKAYHNWMEGQREQADEQILETSIPTDA